MMKEKEYTAPLERRLRRLAKQQQFLDENGEHDTARLSAVLGLHRNTVRWLLQNDGSKEPEKEEE